MLVLGTTTRFAVSPSRPKIVVVMLELVLGTTTGFAVSPSRPEIVVVMLELVLGTTTGFAVSPSRPEIVVVLLELDSPLSTVVKLLEGTALGSSFQNLVFHSLASHCCS